MVLSASRRTDLPRLYSDWLIRRLQAGTVVVKNPMNPAQVSRLHFSPETVDCIVFWTKDPAPLSARLDEVDRLGYRYYFQFTLTPYDRTIETNLREKSELIATFRQLSQRIGRERVVWGYDPILFADGVDLPYHRARFSRMCAELAPYTDTVVVSFVDAYAKLRHPIFSVPDLSAQTELAGLIGATAKRYGLRAVACAESGDWSAYGIGRSACIDRARIGHSRPIKISASDAVVPRAWTSACMIPVPTDACIATPTAVRNAPRRCRRSTIRKVKFWWGRLTRPPCGKSTSAPCARRSARCFESRRIDKKLCRSD